jgi:hypothetical protein
MKSSRLLTATMLFFVMSSLLAQESTKTSTHGTINVLVGNKYGIVVATDSRASDKTFRTINDRSHKLFQLDSTTVCSIAGFASDPGPHWELGLSTGGIIHAFAEAMADSPSKVPFRTQVFVLPHLIGSRLGSLEAEYQSSSEKRTPNADHLFLIFAGLDDHGILSTAKVEISIQAVPRSDGKYEFLPKISDPQFNTITSGFFYLTSGVDDSAQLRLHSPGSFEDEPELNEYRHAVQEGKTGNLSLDQLEELAKYLVVDASRTAHVVGGPIQVALISSGGALMKMPSNLVPDTKPYSTVLFRGIGQSQSPIYPMVRTVPHSVFLDSHCDDAAIILDDSIFVGGRFINCNFYYDGKDVYRDPSVHVVGGQLILGPDVSLTNLDVERVRKEFPELTPISYKDLPDAEIVKEHVWPK